MIVRAEDLLAVQTALKSMMDQKPDAIMIIAHSQQGTKAVWHSSRGFSELLHFVNFAQRHIDTQLNKMDGIVPNNNGGGIVS